MMQIIMRRCKKCKENKHLEEFYRKKGKNIKSDRYAHQCKDCRREYARQYRLNNLAKVNASQKRCTAKREGHYSTWKKNYRKTHKKEHLEYSKKAVENLSDWYVRNILASRKGGKRILKSGEIPQELVELKKQQLILIRSSKCKQNH